MLSVGAVAGTFTSDPAFAAQPTARATLYDRLGGIFAIAAVVNYFSDEVLKDPIAGTRSPNPRLRRWSTQQAGTRLPGLKFMRTLWVCAVAGGPFEYVGTKPGQETHFKLAIVQVPGGIEKMGLHGEGGVAESGPGPHIGDRAMFTASGRRLGHVDAVAGQNLGAGFQIRGGETQGGAPGIAANHRPGEGERAAEHLPGQLPVALCSRAVRIVQHDGFPERRRLAETHVSRDDGPVDSVREELARLVRDGKGVAR